MSEPTVVKSLSTLVTLRERAVDRLASEMAEKRQARERFERNLERLKRLAADASAQGKAPALALNAAYYKQAVLQLADVHRVDLALHEADMAVTQKALDVAAQKREVLGQVLAREQQRVVDAQQKVEQRRQDELASIQWFRSTRS